MSRRLRRLAAGFAAVLAAGSLGGVASGARAAESPPPGPAPVTPRDALVPAGPPSVMTLQAQPAWVQPDGTALLELRIAEPVEGLEVAVTAHRAVTSRSALERTLAGRALGGVEGHVSVPVASLPVDAEGDRLLTIGIQGPESAPEASRIIPGRTGVYPLDIELRPPGARPVTQFVSPLVVIAPGLVPLTLAWVWTFDATPGRLPDGDLRPAAARAVDAGGRLSRLASAAAAAADIPLTLAPTPETMEAWADAARYNGRAVEPAAALAQLRVAAQQPGRQVVGGPYVPLDLGAVVAAEAASELDRQFDRGGDALTEMLGSRPPGEVLLARSLNGAALGRLRQYGVQRLVVPPAALEPVQQRLTPGRPFALGARNRTYSAAVSDPDLAALLGGGDAPALRAARFLAALSLIALEAPREARGVVVVTPLQWDPPRRLLNAVMEGLRGNPAVQPDTLDGFFTRIPPEARDGRPMVRALADRETGELPVSDDAVRSLRRRLAAFTSIVGEGHAAVRNADRAVLTSQADLPAVDGRESVATPQEYLRGARRALQNVTGRVRGPDGQRVTLTARRGSIPITLLNANDTPLQVRVKLESDQLRFPEGAERLLTLASQNTTVSFPVEARSPGAFPLKITVTSPGGDLVVDRSELTVRSTVVSGVGALLTVGAGFFLLVWWGNDLRGSRRRRVGGRRRRPPGGPEGATERPAEAPVPG